MFKLEFKTGPTDLRVDDPASTVARALLRVAAAVGLEGRGTGVIIDDNGNHVGHWNLTHED